MVAIDMSPATLDLAGIRAGDRNQIDLVISQNGDPLDLTGVTLSAQVRVKSTDEAVWMSAVITVTDPPSGAAQMRFPGNDVRAALAGKASFTGVWDLQMQSGSAEPFTIVAGRFTCDMDVTRDA